MSREEQIRAARSCFYQTEPEHEPASLPLVSRGTYDYSHSEQKEEASLFKRWKIDFMIRMFVGVLIFAGVLQWSQIEKDRARLSMVQEYLAKGEYLNEKCLEENIKDVEVFSSYVSPYLGKK